MLFFLKSRLQIGLEVSVEGELPASFSLNSLYVTCQLIQYNTCYCICRASGFTTRSDIGPAREGPSAETVAAAQAARGEEIVDNPDQFADPDDEKNIFAGTVYEQDDEEADRYVDELRIFSFFPFISATDVGAGLADGFCASIRVSIGSGSRSMTV